MIINIINFIILIIFLIGRNYAKSNINRHVKIISIAISFDFILISYLTFFRNALSKISPDMSFLLIFHVCLAIITVTGYILAIIYGVKILKGQRQHLSKIRLLDKIIVPTRILVALTSLTLYLLK